MVTSHARSSQSHSYNKNLLTYIRLFYTIRVIFNLQTMLFNRWFFYSFLFFFLRIFLVFFNIKQISIFFREKYFISQYLLSHRFVVVVVIVTDALMLYNPTRGFVYFFVRHKNMSNIRCFYNTIFKKIYKY